MVRGRSMFKLQLIDLECNLIDHTVDLIKKLKNKKITFVSANRRPIRFVEQKLPLDHLLRTDFYVLDEFVTNFVLKYSDKTLQIHSPLERYFFIASIMNGENEISSKFGGSLKKIFPWAKRVANLFDEIDKHRLSQNLQNFKYAELIEPANVIVEHLKTLYSIYRNEMEAKSITYRGDLYSKMLDILNNQTDFDDFDNSAFIFTNIVYISDTEAKILRKLSEFSDVYFLLYHDLKQRDKLFDSFKAVNILIEKLKVEPEGIVFEDNSYLLPEIIFYSYPDKTTEMDNLANILLEVYKKNQDPLDTAIILPDESSIIPLLVNLPEDKDLNINITMGYPFVNTPFYLFMCSFFELLISTNRGDSDSSFKVKSERLLPIIDYKDLFRDEELKEELGDIKKNILSKLASSYIIISREKHRSFYGLLDKFLKIKNITDLIDAIEELMSFIYTFRSSKDRNVSFTINTINLFIENFIDTLKKITQPLDVDIELSYTIFKEISKDLAIPFEGTPLRGLQIMGILESRGLKFKNIFLPDMNEGVIPSVDKIDPLLSEEIKSLIGLPSFREKEVLMRYNFYRIVFSSEKVYIFYCIGTDGMNKAVRSRYVEQLLFMKELQEEKDLSETINRFTSDFYIPKVDQNYVKNLRQNLNISGTLLDTYLTCPYKYYLKYIKELKTATKFTAEFEHEKIGSLIHEILRENTIIGKTLKESFDPEKGIKIIEDLRRGVGDEKSELHNYIRDMDEIRYNLLINILKYRFNAFIENELNDNPVFAKEEWFSFDYGSHKIVGRVDRIDKIEESKLRIIDYKTGKNKLILSKNKIQTVLDKLYDLDYGRDSLICLKENIPSVQLFVYKLLVKNRFKDYKCEAIYYYFGLSGEKMNEVTTRIDFDDTPDIDKIVFYLINHLENAEYLYPLPGKNCSFCEYNKMCRFGE